MSSKYLLILMSLLISMSLTGCAGKQTFGTAARAGDNVILPLGWSPELKRENLSVVIQPCTGNWPEGIDPSTGQCIQNNGLPISVPPNKVKALTHLQPDLVSKLIVERETRAGSSGDIFAYYAEANFTDGSKELFETVMFMKLPDETQLFPGLASLQITDLGGSVLEPVTLEVLPGTNSSNGNLLPYWGEEEAGLPISINNLKQLDRAPHQVVTFSGPDIPYGLEVTLSHDLDSNHGGSAPVAYVVYPRGDLLSVVWSDDGVEMTVTLMPSWNKAQSPEANESLGRMEHFGFYVAGGVTDLQITDVKAYDIDGVVIQSLVANLN